MIEVAVDYVVDGLTRDVLWNLLGDVLLKLSWKDAVDKNVCTK